MSMGGYFAEQNGSMFKSRGRSLTPREASGTREGCSVGNSGVRSSSRGRSASRRPASRGVPNGEDVNFRWCILRHDPTERFKSSGFHAEDVKDDVSEEELLSDDDNDFDYDINTLPLRNYKGCINDYYLQRSRSSASGEEASRELKVIEKGNLLEEASAFLAIKSAILDAQDLDVQVSQDLIREVDDNLERLEKTHGSIGNLISNSNSEQVDYKAFKDVVIKKSKSGKVIDMNDLIELLNLDNVKKSSSKIISSQNFINKEQPRISKTITFGDFFGTQKGMQAKSPDCYLLYMDLTHESIVSLQYTIGTIVKSGDVLYIVNCVSDEDNIDYYTKQSKRLSEAVKSALEQVKVDNFELHVVVESLKQNYPKHFVNELIKYLNPVLLITNNRLIHTDLGNYMSTIPLLVVKRVPKRRKSFNY